jgi:hypothetical protein
MVGQKADRVAMRAAPEAMIEMLVVVDREARRLLIVEGTAGLPFAPGADQLHAGSDDGTEHGSGAQFVEPGGAKRHIGIGTSRSRLARPQAREANLSTGEPHFLANVSLKFCRACPVKNSRSS